MNKALLVIITIIISAGVFGYAGYYFGIQRVEEIENQFSNRVDELMDANEQLSDDLIEAREDLVSTRDALLDQSDRFDRLIAPITIPEGHARYINPDGVSFLYPFTTQEIEGEERQITIQEVNDPELEQINLAVDGFDDLGHSITIYRYNLLNENLEEKIEQLIVERGYSLEECEIVIEDVSPKKRVYTLDSIEDIDEPGCLEESANSGFIVNPNIPGKIIFANLGQDPLLRSPQIFLNSIEIVQ